MNADLIKSYLYLHAVLPQLTTIAARDEQARAAIDGRAASIQLRTVRGPRARLHANGSGLSFARELRPLPSLGLLLPSPAVAVRMFGGGRATPLPWWGLWRPGIIGLLRVLTGRLAFYLTASKEELERAACFDAAVGLRLAVMVYAIGVLTEHLPEARQAAADAPEGVAEFRFADGSAGSVRLSCPRGGPMRAFLVDGGVTESQAAPANLIVEFQDTRTALGVLSGEWDIWLAIGQAQIKIRGHFPLAQTILRIMGRVGQFLG